MHNQSSAGGPDVTIFSVTIFSMPSFDQIAASVIVMTLLLELRRGVATLTPRGGQ